MGCHRVIEEWMGESVETLEDLLRPGLRAVCVGINPSCVSVTAGHYYQGRLGQLFFSRLRRVGVLPPHATKNEDDIAFACGIGFTDIVKRPTPRATGLRREEYEHGRALLRSKLERFEPELALFTYKRTAEMLFGRFAGNGFVPHLSLENSVVFVMPGPYERPDAAQRTLASLSEWWGATRAG